MNFLYDNTIKLYRSPTEGNILVKLTNISLSPQTVLGRMLYSFSATATEIADLTIDNYLKYNILQLKEIPVTTGTQYAYTNTPVLVTYPSGSISLEGDNGASLSTYNWNILTCI
jgi:hypothetical protein